MLSNGYSYCPHYGPAGIARRRPRPDSARAWPAPAISLFFLFCALSLTAMPLKQNGWHIARIPFNLKRGASAGLRHWRHNSMLRSGNRVSAYSAWFMLFAVFGLTSCNLSNQPKLPKPPFKTPISSLSGKGVVADFNIRITSYDIYEFKLRFEYPEGDQAERERVRNIIGDAARDKDNNLVTPGILTPVKLTIYKKQAQGEQIVYQKTENPYLTSGGGSTGYFAKTIGHCDLKRGEYRFVLESLAQPQEYASIPTKFHIGTEPKLVFIPINIDRSKTCPQ